MSKRATDADIIHGDMKPKKGHKVLFLCSTCPAGRALVRRVARKVRKDLGIK